MNKLWPCLALILALSAPARAQRFFTGSSTQPVEGSYFVAAGAAVYWEKPGGASGQWPLFLGKSGGPTSAAWPTYPGRLPSPAQRDELLRRLAILSISSARITFIHPGFENTTVEVPIGVLREDGSWPSKGYVAMSPVSKSVVFHSMPEGAEVHLGGADGLFLARSGEPALLLMPTFLGAEGTFVDRTLSFVHPGYRTRQEIVRPDRLLETGVFPPDGTVALAPATFWVAVRDGAHRWAGWAAAAVVGIGAGLFATRRRKATPLSEVEERPAERRLGRWLLGTRIGAGGSATVYRARGDDGEEVAVKILDEDAAEEEAERRRFEREMAISCRLSHPNIVRVIDYDAHAPQPYLVMELLEGQPLRRLLAEGPLPLDRFRAIFRPLLEAMRYAHGQGVVHRDLKPENVILNGKGIPKVVDFGIARGQLFATVTTTGRTVGTMAYLPPERFVAAITDDPRSDQYALGVMAWELLVGRRPWPDSALGEVMLGIVQVPPIDLRAVRPEVSRDLADVVARMMALAIDDRFETVEEALRAFQAAS
jgi:tRNA A-37 threonylcarbamoyl transferase component Bud32